MLTTMQNVTRRANGNDSKFSFQLVPRALEKKQENGETIELSAEGRPELVEEKEMPVVDCTCFGLPRRYIIAILSGIGFCISFGIRCNLGVAIVSMVNSHTVYRDNKEVIVVSKGGGGEEMPS